MTFLPEMPSPQSKDEHRCVDTEQKESLRLGTLRFFEWFGTGKLTLRSRLLQSSIIQPDALRLLTSGFYHVVLERVEYPHWYPALLGFNAPSIDVCADLT